MSLEIAGIFWRSNANSPQPLRYICAPANALGLFADARRDEICGGSVAVNRFVTYGIFCLQEIAQRLHRIAEGLRDTA